MGVREPRLAANADVKVTTRDDTPLALGRVVDMSRSGLKMNLGLRIDEDFPVSVAFEQSGGEAVRIDAQIRWAHQVPRGYMHGVAFAKLDERKAREVDALLGKASA